MDRIMGGAGLHGRAFIPLLSSFACAIPGIMATRVIDNPRDRLTTILVAPLMTCSARIPVYTLIISAFIPDKQVLGLGRPAGTGDVRALRRRHRQRARRLVRGQVFLLARQPDAAVHAGTARLQAAAAAQRPYGSLHAGEDLPATRRHHDLLDDGADLVSRLVSAPAGRRAPGRPSITASQPGLGMRSSRCWRRSGSTGRSTSP